ncbi:hypothetical protein EYD45_11740 [Hyunsoonleella flava]|uniref:Uncharacterized protein n=1 Tax=Hyunsoonleella flava TaxID=2527939 RepID=A0A4Q9FBD8_9FLAO|nr:hypothetical protein [Hyunsoonleella flava]TBN02377.1 hypothetical protein EYD45_11740 [Hyunsoonleella flava]
MKKLITIFTIALSICLFTNCEEDDGAPAILEIDYVGFESRPLLGVDPNLSAIEEIKIATSNTASSDRTFNITVNADVTTADPSAYSVPSSVTVPANSNLGTFNLEIVGPNINPSGEDILALDFVTQEGLNIGATMQMNLKQVCPNPELILDITFDNWPEEIYWRIVNAAGDTVFESATPAGFGAYDGLTGGITRNICLASGTYTFSIFDGFEDGAGPFSLTFDGEVIFSSDGSYGARTDVTVTIP